MTEKTLTTENIKPALDALRGELAPWPVVAKKQDRLNAAQLNAANSGITSSLVAQIIANTAAIRALESAITGTGLRALVVSSLPAIGTQGILYIVPVTTYDPETDADVVNYSNEYLWIPVEGGTASEGHYEQVGQTGIVINNGQLTITVNGTSVGTFTANQSGDTTAAITVPTNADYVDLTTDQTVAGVKTFSSTINGTASKAIADEDGTSIKTGYVNVAGNQTVTGQKTWSGNQFYTAGAYHRNNSYEIGNTPASNVAIPIYFTDKVNVHTGYVRNAILTTGRTQSELLARNKFTSGALSPTGTDVSSTLQVEVQSNGDKTIYFDGSIRNNVLPYTTNTYSLGSSSYQWSSVYAQTYYYNGTAWGLNQNNTWTGDNTFSSILNQNINSIYSEIPSSDHFAVKGVTDNNGDNVFAISFADRSSGQRDLTLRVYNTDGTQQGVGLYKNNDNSYDYKPMLNGVVNLGTSTNQWKSVYAQTYYYNGTAWGLDKENQWLVTQIIKQDTIDITTNPSAEKIGKSLYFSDGSRFWAQYVPVWGTDGSFRMELGLSNYTTSGGQGYWVVTNRISKDFTTLDFYTSHGNANLGTSTNKWRTLNGINPGALSLPDISSFVELDSTGWDLDGTATDIVASGDGWIQVVVTGDSTSYVVLQVGYYGYPNCYYRATGNAIVNSASAMIPVKSGQGVRMFLKGTSIYIARFFPMLGNV